MSDLIRREDVTRLVNQFVFGLCKAQNDEVIKIFNKYVEKIPTAYSVDKVVEELEEIKGSTCDGKSCSECEYTSDCFEGEQSEKVAIDKAIEIVKQGGVGTETETIRDKAVKWNNNSSKRVPYEFIDYVEGRREIGVSDDVCEWKYTKEIMDNAEFKVGCNQNALKRGIVPNNFSYHDFKYCPYCGKKIKVVE